MSDRVLFISGRCDHCKKILVGIQQHSFLKPLFKIVNVDSQPYPNYVKTVPSILINGQIISGQTVFEYFGKLVEGKKSQEERVSEGQAKESDQGQCRINEDGELEGYCGSSGLGGSGVEFSMITEENDDYTKKTYKMESAYDFLDGSSGDIQAQVKSMEAKDAQLSSKQKSFDSDMERMQRERGEQMGQQSGPGGQRPPMGQGPGQGPGPMGGQNMMR
jgi:hypothetical protein